VSGNEKEINREVAQAAIRKVYRELDAAEDWIEKDMRHHDLQATLDSAEGELAHAKKYADEEDLERQIEEGEKRLEDLRRRAGLLE
jgi:hypothetical protein